MNKSGGYTEFRPIDNIAQNIFDKIYLMIQYKYPTIYPYLYKTQVVAGINYYFQCYDKSGAKIILIVYENLKEELEIIKLEEII